MNIEQPTADEYKTWVNDKVTCYVRNKLIEQRKFHSSLDNSLADFTAHGNSDYDLQKIGLNAAMSMAIVKGIDLFTDHDQFYAEHYPESEAKDAKV